MASHELDIADDIEASEYFNLAVLNNGVTLKVSEPLEQQTELPPRRNLFAVSNLFGLAVAGTNNGFAVYTLAALRQAYTSAKQRTQAVAEPLRTVAVGSGGLSFIKIGLADKVVIASGPALQGGIGVWRLKSLVDGTSTEPLHIFPPASSAPLLDVLPNPGDRPELLALLSQDGHIVMINMESKATIATFGEGVTAACWSVKGKQLVTGDQNGNLVQFTPEGELKTGTDAPTSLRERGVKALDIRWVENAVFFVTYCEVENPMDTSIFVITRAKDGSVTYAPILDPLMVETMDRPEARFNAWMKNWTPFKHLLLVCNATSNTIGHVGLGPVGEGGSNIAWSCVKNDLYTTLPLETYPLGLEIDYTDTTAPPSDENTGTKPLPLLWSYASDGSLSAWRMVNLQGEQYPSIASPHDIVTQEDAGSVAGAAASSTQIAAAPAPTAATASPFGTASPAAAFGSTTFGSGAFSSPPSFGRPPTFGAPPSFAPAFGQATFGTASAFGKPAFGQPALQPAAAPTKGGFSGFSQQSSAFASPSPSGASSPFASSAASPSPTPAFVSTQPTTFGTSTFGQSGVTSGTASMATSPAPAAFGQSSPFGAAASTTSPFGSTKPASGGFGSFASSSDNKTSSSGFGAFSSTTPASTAGFSFGAATTDPQKNAFGIASPSAFGAIREDTAATPSSAVKPPGLDENDAEDMEPVNTASQQGGAFDFGNDKNSDDGKPANTLSFGGLGFGGDKTAPATKVAPSAFGSFAPPSVQNPATTSSAFSASTSTSASSPFSFKPKTDTSENKPAFGFSGFGQESAGSKPKGDAAPSADTSTPSPVTKPAEGAKGASADAATKVTFGFGTLSPSTEDKKASPATTSPFGGFGSSASFGKTTQFGQASAFGQTSAFGQKSAFGTPSTPSEKPAFAFGKSTSDASVSGGFAGFASPAASTSKSPFASPSTQSSPVTSTFGQPGLFSAKAAQAPAAISESEERKPKDENNLKDSNVPVTESDKVPPQVPTSPLTTSPPAESAGEVVSKPPAETEAKQEDIPSASDNSDHEGDEVEVKQEDLSQDEEWDEEEDEHSEAAEEDFEGQEDEVETDEQEDEEYDEEVEDQTTDAAQPEEQQDNEEVSDDVSDEAKDLGNHSEAADETSRKSGASADESLASEASSEDVSSPPASPSPAPPSSRKPEAATESTTRSSFTPTKSAFSFAPAEDKGSNQAGPATNASWSLGKQGGDEGTPKTANNPFAGLSQAAPDRPTNETPKPDTAKSGSALQSGFAGFGQSAAKTSTSTQGSLPFAAPVKAVDSPKPFGLGNLQKATPRTSSPLASMPAFVPPASPSQTQSSFDLSNLSSAPSSPVTSPSKSSKPLPASTTPQSKAPPPNFFKQPESIPSQKGQSRQQSGALENKVTAEPVVQTPNTPALPTIAPPKLSSTIPKARQAAQVSQDTLNIFITMQDHLDALKESAAVCMSFFHSVQPARLPKDGFAGPVDVLSYDGQWGMGDLPRLREATRSLSKALSEVAHHAKDEEKAARSLEGSLLKAKAKAEEINRYLRAREDPQVAKMVRVRQLGPEQLENQNRIRKQTQNVTEALNELERTITNLKQKVVEEKLGRSPMQAPSLDSIHRAMRNLTGGLQSKVAELDDIALRLDMMTLSTNSPVRHRDSTPRAQRLIGGAVKPSSKSLDESVSHPSKSVEPRITSRIERNVRKALAAEEFGQQLKEAWLARHKEPLLNNTANKASL